LKISFGILKNESNKIKRVSIRPGTILILLSGRYRGRRVVFLKQLRSGLLLVTGPFKVNGVPVRRVNKSYVISTTTSINISGIDTSRFDDTSLSTTKNCCSKKKTRTFAQSVHNKHHNLKQERMETQETIDNALLVKIKEVPQLKKFLSTRFSLRSGDRPHLMAF
jgi:large subunit ribosomal protein L6e